MTLIIKMGNINRISLCFFFTIKMNNKRGYPRSHTALFIVVIPQRLSRIKLYPYPSWRCAVARVALWAGNVFWNACMVNF